MPTVKERKQTFNSGWSNLLAAARAFASVVENAGALKAQDTSAVEDAFDDLEDALDDLKTARTALQDNYPQVTVNSIIYDIVVAEMIHNGETITAEDVDGDSDLAEELVESGSSMLRVHKPTAEFSADDTTIDVDVEVEFTDESTNEPASWSWDFGDGETSTEQNPTHAYAEAGTYTVILIATNAGGSSTKTRSNYITVSEG